jgi:hypothetical protein
MHTVFPGDKELRRRLMRQMWQEMFINLIKRILGRSSVQKNEEPPGNCKS